MRKLLVCLTAMLPLFLLTFASFAQEFSWNTKSKAAQQLAAQGINHLMNVERELAYQDFKDAVKADPNFMLGQFYIGILSQGATKNNYLDKVTSSSGKLSEGEKLLISLNDNKTKEERYNTWSKLLKLYPNDERFQYMNIYMMPDSVAAFNKMEEFSKKHPNLAAAYNTLGYMSLLNRNDTAMARQYFQKYIQAYPDGYNPYDSMADYYEHIGDKENAKKYYELCLEKYPFSVNAIQRLEALKQ